MRKFSIFNSKPNCQLTEPMFLGKPVNIARYDQQKYPIFESLIDTQLSFFWRSEEIDVSQDRIDYMGMSDSEKHIFTKNLQYQILLDSIQGRSPNLAFLPIVSIPELETWVETWSFYETIHSRSYTHIIRNIVTDPGIIFDDILQDEHIIERAKDLSHYYDKLITMSNVFNLFGEGTFEVYGEEVVVTKRELKKLLYLTIMSVNVLEAIRFYVSFACSFAFGERKLMEGNAKIIRLIARDEALHMVSTQHLVNILQSGQEGEEFAEIAEECEGEVIRIFKSAADQEKDWARYLFKDGSMIGLNEKILCHYVDFITNQRMAAVGLKPLNDVNTNPIPWINNWLNSDNVQVAPQEVEISSYLVGQVDSAMSTDDMSDFKL